jgi:hypothetical protein
MPKSKARTNTNQLNTHTEIEMVMANRIFFLSAYNTG